MEGFVFFVEHTVFILPVNSEQHFVLGSAKIWIRVAQTLHLIPDGDHRALMSFAETHFWKLEDSRVPLPTKT